MITLNKKQVNALLFVAKMLRKHKIPFQISGGFAAKIYGSPRKLNDIDIEVPQKGVYLLAPHVERYIIDGPKHIRGYGWDVHLLELKYGGQLIDISGVENVKIKSRITKEWIDISGPIDPVRKKVSGLVLPVVKPEGLAAYKQHLRGKHQRTDVEAIRQYLKPVHPRTCYSCRPRWRVALRICTPACNSRQRSGTPDSPTSRHRSRSRRAV
jgi:hypothetical protein